MKNPFKKDPEPRSWGGQTASELASDNGDGKDKKYSPPKCTDSHHVTPVEYYRNDKIKKMSCQTCGANWVEKL